MQDSPCLRLHSLTTVNWTESLVCIRSIEGFNLTLAHRFPKHAPAYPQLTCSQFVTRMTLICRDWWGIRAFRCRAAAPIYCRAEPVELVSSRATGHPRCLRSTAAGCRRMASSRCDEWTVRRMIYGPSGRKQKSLMIKAVISNPQRCEMNSSAESDALNEYVHKSSEWRQFRLPELTKRLNKQF